MNQDDSEEVSSLTSLDSMPHSIHESTDMEEYTKVGHLAVRTTYGRPKKYQGKYVLEIKKQVVGDSQTSS